MTTEEAIRRDLDTLRVEREQHYAESPLPHDPRCRHAFHRRTAQLARAMLTHPPESGTLTPE